MRMILSSFGLVCLLMLAGAQPFTYQGFLKENGNPANGTYQMTFRLFSVASGGTALATVGPVTVTVSDGLFTQELNFGNVWTGADRFLEIQVGSTTLSPRVRINPTPYANTTTLLNMFQTGTSNPDRMVITHSPALTNWGLQYRDSDDTFHFLGGGVSRFRVGLFDGRVEIPGTLRIPTGAAAGRVLTSNASGDASWQDLPAGASVWAVSGNNIYNSNTGNVGIGTSSPLARLHVETGTEDRALYGYATATSGFNYGVYGASASTSGTGVFGWAAATIGFNYGGRFESASTDGTGVYSRATATSGITHGGWFQSASPSGRGVFGWATATSGFNYGVYGLSASIDGTGVLGRATATRGPTYGGRFESASPWGIGVSGEATATSGTTYGVYGRSDSPLGTGVLGRATATSNSTYGGWFESASTSGRGVFGWATATSGFNYGGRFESASTDGTGVFGQATATSGFNYGGRFENVSTSGTGVYGWATATSGTTYGGRFKSDSTSGRGVLGSAYATSGTTYGVYGASASTLGYGVYSWGRFAASGTKSFQIDHPLHPETRYLNHFCTEAPEPLNAYSGNVVTDARGYATVQLPDYFESINRDFRYQLTVIDSSDDFVLAKVVREIQNNQFVIRTNKPHVKVSWEVKAIRNDRWVQEYGYQTEQEKPQEHQGKYLHPELYGQPKERGIHHQPELDRPREVEKPQ